VLRYLFPNEFVHEFVKILGCNEVMAVVMQSSRKIIEAPERHIDKPIKLLLGNCLIRGCQLKIDHPRNLSRNGILASAESPSNVIADIPDRMLGRALLMRHYYF